MESQLQSKGLIFSGKKMQMTQPSSTTQQKTFQTQNVIIQGNNKGSGFKSTSTYITNGAPKYVANPSSSSGNVVYQSYETKTNPVIEVSRTIANPNPPQIAICEWKIPEVKEVTKIYQEPKAPTYERRVESTYTTQNSNTVYVTSLGNEPRSNSNAYQTSGNVKILSSNVMSGNYVTSNKSSSVFDKKPTIKTINLSDLPTVGQEEEMPVQSLVRKSTIVKTMSIFDLEDVSKKEKKVIQMGKKLQKEKIIISHDGEVKKEENETTLIIKNMEVDEEEEVESLENEETENMEQEDSDLPLEKEIEQEVEAQTGIVLNEKENVRESKREMIVDQLMDDIIGKYDTNFTAEEEVIISEYKENLLNNYLDETMNNVEAANESFFNENNKSYNGKDVNLVVSEDLKKKLQEIPVMLKEAEEQGVLDQMIKEKEIEMKKNETEEVENEEEVESEKEEEETKEVAQEEEKEVDNEDKEEFQMIIIKEDKEEEKKEEEEKEEEEVVNAMEEKVEENEPEKDVEVELVEVVVEEGNDKEEKFVDTVMIEVKEDSILEEPEHSEGAFEEDIEMETKTEEFKEPAVVEIYKENLEEEEEEEEEPQLEMKMNKRTAPVETHTHALEVVTKKVDEEGEEVEVVETIEIIHNEDKHYEHKLEHLEDYIQDADQAGFFDELVEKKRQKEQENKMEKITENIEEKQEKPSSQRNMFKYAKDKQNKFAFGEIKQQLMIEANIKPKEEPEKVVTRKPDPVPVPVPVPVQKKEESDIEFEDAFGSEDDIKQETTTKTVQSTFTKQPVPVRVQPTSNNGVSRVVTNTTKNVSVKRINLDSFDIRRYKDKDHHSLTQSRLAESGTWAESIRSSRPGGVTAYPEDRTSMGMRTGQSNVNRIGSNIGRTNNFETTKQTYQRFENIKQMNPVKVESSSQLKTNRIGLNNWNSSNSNLKTSNVITKNTVTSSQRTPVQKSGTNTRLQTMDNEYKKSSNYKVSTLSSIIKSNVNQTQKKPSSYNTSSISSTQKKEYSNTRTPTTRTGQKKKINLSHYRSKKVSSSNQPLRFTESRRNQQREMVTNNATSTNINNNSGVRVGNNLSSTQTSRTIVSRSQGVSTTRTQNRSNVISNTSRVIGSSGNKRRIKI
jgi:hypothetical protein